MICIIRIHGKVKIKKDIEETLHRLKLRRKYSCVVFNITKENMGMIKKVRNFVAFGDISRETLEKLIEKRGQFLDKKKIDVKKAAEEIMAGKKPEEAGIKPFFRLHPPRGGIKSKVHFPKGILGNNGEKINDLVKRML